MRTFAKVLVGIVLASMLFAASCCCTGGLDDDHINQNLPGTHNEGGGGEV